MYTGRNELSRFANRRADGVFVFRGASEARRGECGLRARNNWTQTQTLRNTLKDGHKGAARSEAGKNTNGRQENNEKGE